MNYIYTHALIAVLIQVCVWFLTGSLLIGAFAGAGFYTVRELYQYFVIGKRHKGRFDWEGMISPIVATGLVWVAFKFIL